MFQGTDRYNIGLIFLALFFSAIISLTGCSQSRVTHIKLTSIEITPLLSSVSIGTEIQLSATAFYNNGSKNNATSEVKWVSSNPQIISISPGGKLKSLTSGTSTISATLDSKSASVQLTVNSAVLKSLNINPANPQIHIDTQTELSVFGIYDDGSKLELTNIVTWQNVSNTFFTRNNSTISGKNAGSATITASYADLSATIQVDVISAALREIAFDIPSTIFHPGNPIKLRATGIFSDGNYQDISQLVSWSYTSPTASTIIRKDDTISSNTPGNITITASLNGVSNSQTVTISPATLESLEISSLTPYISTGEKLQLTAIGRYSNNITINLTELVFWSSTDKSILEVSNGINFEGQAIGKKVGSVTINAAFENLNADLTIEITPATLTSISISNQHQDIAKGTSLSLVATGIYSDKTSRDITNAVTWFSNDPVIIHVNNQTERAGIATGLDIGTTKILANIGDITSSIDLTVTSASLTNISISNLVSEVIVDTDFKLEATGIFSDGSKQNLTKQVVWSSSHKDIALISTGELNGGSLKAINIGTTTINASLNHISADSIVVVHDAVITDITLSPTLLSLAEGTTSQLTAFAHLSNGNTLNVTHMANWESNSPATASVGNISYNKGNASAIQSGNAVISASLNNISGSSPITVTSATLVSIEIDQQNATIANNTNFSLVATGIFSNGTHQNITQNVLWESSNPDILLVSNSNHSSGIVNSLSEGTASISATLENVVGNTTINVSTKSLDTINILIDGSNELVVGNQINLRAEGIYSDGSTMNISDQVVWQSSSEDTCEISTAENNYGLLKAKTAGSCNIKASLEQTYQSLLFSIKDASLQSISISPDNILIVKGTQIQLTATGYYSDNTSSDISNQVHWKSSNTFTSVSNENEAKGLTSAIEVGSSTVTANYKDISGTATITVGAATLESITVSSISSDDFLKGTNKSFIAIGTYSDQSTQDISKQVLWSTSNKTIATASNAYATAGQLTGINAGSIILSATFDSISSNQLNITIIDDPAAAVSLSSDATPYIILNDGVDSAIITLSAKAADTTAIVSDGTEIQLEIVDGIGTISTASVTTINGEAAFNITSDTKNLIKIKASIVGTEIFSIAYVNVVDTFKEVITRYGSVTGSLNNDLVAVGSKMEFKIRNDSNRPFIIEGYRVLNNNAIVVQTSDPAILNNNTLSAEGNIVVVFTTTQELSNSYIGVYYLREPTTNMQFFVAASFTF